jgi:hypothetical protein
MMFVKREMLSDDQWATLRDAPQLVILAVAASGGSRLDLLLERTAGARAVANGKNHDHPLMRAIASPDEIDAAMAAVKARTLDARGSLRSPAELQQLAADAVRQAATVLRATGGELDLYAYRQFIMEVARWVAEAAREDDFLGIGGQRVSDAERAVIAAVTEALES